MSACLILLHPGPLPASQARPLPDVGAAQRESQQVERSAAHAQANEADHRDEPGMSLDLPVEAGSEAGSCHIASSVSGPLQRPCSLAPPGVPPLSGEGSAQPSLAQPGRFIRLSPPPISLPTAVPGSLGRELLGNRGISAHPFSTPRGQTLAHGTSSCFGLWAGPRERPLRLCLTD